MKYQFECNERETRAFVGLASEALGLLGRIFEASRESAPSADALPAEEVPFVVPPAPAPKEETLDDLWGRAAVPSSDPVATAPSVSEVLRGSDLTAVREGLDLWYGLLSDWQEGLGDPDAEQPDRVALVQAASRQGGIPMQRALRHYGGLTQLVEGLFPGIGKGGARRVAEHVAQVCSACGFTHYAEALEYDPRFLTKEYKHVDRD